MKKIKYLFAPLFVVVPLSLFAQQAIELSVEGLSCPFCVFGVEKKLKKIPGIAIARSDLKTGTFALTKEAGARLDLEAIRKAVKEAGFTPAKAVLTVEGTLTEWEGKAALKEKTTGQFFLLVELGKDHAEEFLSSQKFSDLKKAAQKNNNRLAVRGPAHSHADMPIALAVEKFWTGK